MDKYIIRSLVLLFIFVTLLFSGCSTTTSDSNSQPTNSEHSSETKTPTEWNISVYLDLSNRLVRPMTPTQAERDITLISYMVSEFTSHCKSKKVRDCNDHFQIFFYPSPSDPEISALSKELDTELEGLENLEKQNVVESMSAKYSSALEKIYSSTLKNRNWVGCDIWSFFNNKKVDNMCVRPGYRNILIILTDGFIYHIDNVTKIDGTYTYIPANVSSSTHSLNVSRDGLSNLEVLVLEVNPMRPKQFQILTDIWGKWLSGMGITHYDLVETDLPNNNKHAVKSFLLKTE